MTLTKAQIVETISEQLKVPKNSAFEIVENLIGVIKNTLEAGEDLLVSGFGKFTVKQKRQRRGRNPATGEEMMLEPRQVVTFKCSGKLRERVNGK